MKNVDLNPGTQILSEVLHSKFKVVCLNGLELKESRSVQFKRIDLDGNRVYYVTEAGYEKLQAIYKVQFIHSFN